MLPLFEQMKEILDNGLLKDALCPACQGEGYEYEMKDSDSRMKVPCKPCGGKGGKMKLQLATGKERKERGIKKMNESKDADRLNELFDSFIDARLWEARQPDSALGNGWNVYEFTADDVRQLADNRGGYEAVHPNAWGSLYSRYAKAERIEKTGDYKPSNRPTSHGRIIPIWRIIK